MSPDNITLIHWINFDHEPLKMIMIDSCGTVHSSSDPNDLSLQCDAAERVWSLVYAADANGFALEGSIDALIAAVRRGDEIKISNLFGVQLVSKVAVTEHADGHVSLFVTYCCSACFV